MFVDLKVENQYFQAAEKCLEEWVGKSEGLELRLYQSVEHAISEVAQGLAQAYSHRNELVFFKGLGPHYRRPMLQLARRGLIVHSGSFKEFTNSLFIQSQLNGNSLLVAYSLDDPLTGRLFSTAAVHEFLEGKKVFRLLVHHSLHLYERPTFQPQPHEIHVFAVPGQGAVALLGQRARALSDMGPFLDWKHWSIKSLHGHRSTNESDRKAILKWEQNPPAGAMAILAPQEARLWDRVALSWTDIDGWALVEQLVKILEARRGPGPWQQQMETASLCRWHSLDSTQWLLDQGLSAQQARGLVVLGRDLVQWDGFFDIVVDAANQLRQRQRLSV